MLAALSAWSGASAGLVLRTTPRVPTPRMAASNDPDVIVIGSGLGGLSCAALCARYGYSVVVLEKHSIPGGCAHSFERGGFTFDSGPSLWSGCASPSTNPLRQVLDAVGESPEWVQYDGWMMYTEDGEFEARSGDEESFRALQQQYGGEAATREWDALREFIEPLQRAVLAVPPIALRADLGAAATVLPYLPALADPRIGLRASLLSGPWSNVLRAARVSNRFLARWFDFLAFAFSGLPSDGTVAAAMVYMLAEFYKPGAKMDYPLGGSGAVVDALVRGVTKRGGEVRLRAEVSQLLFDDNADDDARCTGVRLKSGEELRARVGVVSNAPVWATAALLPDEFRMQAAGGGSALDEETPATPSFMHLHLGFRADDLPAAALRSIHHIVIPAWEELMAPQSTVFVSIPSLLDPSLAPEGHHVLHAYLPATEPFELWEGLDPKSDEYARLKQERAACLYSAIERFIPDIRARVVLELIGSPLTHRRFLGRHRGTYGPELRAGVDGEEFPGATSAVPGLYCCGDSTWPGIGVPAVAGSGIAAAHAITGVGPQRELLQDMRERDVLRPAA